MSENFDQIRILCVDDERNILRALERVFLDDDYEIALAGSGDEGLNTMEESGPFQVVISDYRMPVMNGVEFLKAVYERWPETVRIVLSGYADAAAIVAAINEGHIYKFIPKPWNDNELRITIQNCLERYFLQKKNHDLLEQLAVVNQALEEKVRQRTEQLELRNQELNFSRNLLANLPVGVVGIDENGIIAYCNDLAAEQLKQVCGDISGVNVAAYRDDTLGALVEQVRREKSVSAEITLGDKSFRVMAHTIAFFETVTVVLVFLEV
ncbi:MAG: response regulator [Pedobacter sp.]